MQAMRLFILLITVVSTCSMISAFGQAPDPAAPPLEAAKPEAAAAAPAPGQDQLDFANGLFGRGFFDEAVEEYEAYLAKYPSGEQSGTAWFRLGQSAYATEKYEKALPAFEKAAATAEDPTTKVQAQLGRGESLYFLKRPAEALEILKPITADGQAADARCRALYYVGRSQQDMGSLDAAAQDYAKLAEVCPEHALAPYAQYQLANVSLAKNLLEDAAVAFSKVASDAKAEETLRMESRFRTAEIYDKIGWASAAVGAYEQLKKDFPNSDYAKRADYGYSWALYNAGKYPEAAEAAAKFISENSDASLLPGMKYLLANCLQQQKKYDEALAVYREIADKFPDSTFASQARYKKAWSLYLKGDLPGAKAEALAFLQKYQDSPQAGEAGFLLGSILVAEGNYEDAREEFRLVAEKYPDSTFGPESLFKSAECLAQLGMRDEAAKVYEEFAKKYPDNALTEQAILRAGDAQFSTQDFAQAVTKYETILSKHLDPAVEQDTLYRLAVTCHNMKDRAKSAETFRKLVEKFPGSKYVAEAHFRIAEYQLREQKDAIKAVEEYQAALDSKPEAELAGRATLGLALARYERKDYDQAADLFLKIVTDFPKSSLPEEIYTWCGQWFFDAKQWDKASKMFEAMLAGLADYPYPDKVRFKIAECSESAGNADDALLKYQAVIDASPSGAKSVEARYRMAALLEAKNETDKAIALYEAASESNTGDTAAQARFRLGELYEKRGEFERAARNYMRVAILFLHETLSPESLWRAGQCFEKVNGTNQAKGAYEELVKDYPKAEQAAKAGEALARLGVAPAATAPVAPATVPAAGGG